MGCRPQSTEYEPHPQNAGPLASALDLTWTDLVQIATTQETFDILPSVRRIDAAWALEEFTLPPMLCEAFNAVGVRGVVNRTADCRHSQEDELSIALASRWVDDTFAAPVDGAAAAPPRFVVTPAVTRCMARRATAPLPPQLRTEETPDPPPARSRRRRSKRRGKGKAKSPSPCNEEPEQLSRPTGSPQHPWRPTRTPQHRLRRRPRSRRKAVVTLPPPVDVGARPLGSQPDDHLPLDTPDVCRGRSTQLARMEDTLRDTTQLVHDQPTKPTLRQLRDELETGRGQKSECFIADDDLLWHAPRGRADAIAVPRQLVPAVLALVHGTYGHPEPRSHIDAVTQALDGATFGQGLERTVADQQRLTQEILKQRHEAKNKLCERHNARIARESPGAKVTVDDLVLVKEPINTLHRDSHHPKLAHDHYISPWKVINTIRDRQSFTVQLNGRRIRQRRVAAADIKPYHKRPDHLKLEFEDEHAHLVWSADLGLADTSVLTVALYTLVDGKALRLFPISTPVGREFVDSEGHPKIFKATVFDYCDPYWRVEYPDGDWEDLTKREMDAGVGVAAQPSFSA
eukprot:g19591.t2